MNENNGPDILGICELENRWVIEKLTESLKHLKRHKYEIVHADTKDDRGIDVAFIYDAKKFEIEKDSTTGEKLIFSHFIVKRKATRDILQVNFKTKGLNNRLVLIGNHWPSRSGGQYESEPYRMIAGETLSYFHQRILEENNKDEGNTAVLVMGDFNDEPFSRSVMDYSLATASLLKVKQSKDAPRLFNLMWPILANGVGTFYYNNFPNLLDQFMISKGVVGGSSAFKVQVTEIIIFPEMVKGRYKQPIKFGRPSDKSLNENGFSDHLPISLILEENR